VVVEYADRKMGRGTWRRRRPTPPPAKTDVLAGGERHVDHALRPSLPFMFLELDHREVHELLPADPVLLSSGALNLSVALIFTPAFGSPVRRQGESGWERIWPEIEKSEARRPAGNDRLHGPLLPRALNLPWGAIPPRDAGPGGPRPVVVANRRLVSP